LSPTDPGVRAVAAADADAGVEQGGAAADVVSGSPSRLAAAKSAVPAASAEEPHIPLDVSSSHATQPGKSTASDSSSS